MADGRKRLSGSQYKKHREEKQQKLKDVLKNTPKLDHFGFKSEIGKVFHFPLFFLLSSFFYTAEF